MRIAITLAALGLSVGFGVWFMSGLDTAAGPAVAELDDDLAAMYARRAAEREGAFSSSVGEAWPPPLLREPIPEHVVRRLFPNIGNGRLEYHPTLFQRRLAHLDTVEYLSDRKDGAYAMRTNSLGFRGEREPLDTPPDLRVLVTGASNAEGKCDDTDAAPSVLERLLARRDPERSVEVLNAGCAGYSFYNTLAVLEEHIDLQPDVFCLIAYGGNDFFGNLKFERWFARRGPPRSEPYGYAELAASDDPFLRRLVGTEVGQAVYYLNNPEGEQLTIDTACAATREMQRLCAERGVRFVCLYLPPPLVAQPDLLASERRRALELAGLHAEVLQVSERIADAWLAYCDELGAVSVDLRPRFRASTTRLFWETDTHIDVAGQQVVAEALADCLNDL